MSAAVTIGAPTLLSSGDKCHLQSEVTIDGVTKTMRFTVPSAYGSYLVTERADAFLVALLPSIARRGGEAEVLAPVSTFLLHNIRHFLSPVMPLLSPELVGLNIHAQADDTNFRKSGVSHVGTGNSCGVDSMSTVVTGIGPEVPESLRVDTLTFFNAGSHGGTSGPFREELYRGRYENARAFAQELGMPMMTIDTNLPDFRDGWHHVNLHTFWGAACVLILQKYFSVYHRASTVHIKDMKFDIADPGTADEYLLRCLSTESTTFYSAVPAYGRKERTALLADFKPAQHHLNVCLSEAHNCGKCKKCLRTMLQLDYMGKLQSFAPVFPVETWQQMGLKAKIKTARAILRDKFFVREFLEQAKDAEAHGMHPVFSLRFLNSVRVLMFIGHCKYLLLHPVSALRSLFR